MHQPFFYEGQSSLLHVKLVDVEVYEFLLQVYFSTNCISCLSENSTMSRKVVICIAFAYVKELSNFVVCKMGRGGGGSSVG